MSKTVVVILLPFTHLQSLYPWSSFYHHHHPPCWDHVSVPKSVPHVQHRKLPTILHDIIPVSQVMKLRLRKARGLFKVAQLLFPFCPVTSEAGWWERNSICSTKITHKPVIFYYTRELVKDSFIFVKESPWHIPSDPSGDAVDTIKQYLVFTECLQCTRAIKLHAKPTMKTDFH